MTVGQLSFGITAVGMLAVGVLWSSGFLGAGGFAGPGGILGLLPQPRARRILAWARREPWDPIPGRRPAWTIPAGLVALACLAIGWWFGAGQPLTAI